MQLYGVRGWGSAITECMLSFVSQPYVFIDVTGFDQPGPGRERLSAVNPLAQVPALVLDDGQVLTETAAITLHLADRFPTLAPAAGTPQRSRFYRLLIWVVANVYPTFTYGDYPARWAPGAPQDLLASTSRHREQLYLWLNKEIQGPFILGERPSALDLYLAVLAKWEPGPAWFRENAPRLADVGDRAARLPLIKGAMSLNGWE